MTDFSTKIEDKRVTLLYNNKKLAVFSRKVLTGLLADLSLDEDTTAPIDEKDIEKTAFRLMKFYTSQKSKFFGGRPVKPISPSDRKNYTHFIKAAEMLITQGVTYKDFLASQIQGLSFINQGEGQFPKINQLATEGAETRLLDFLREKDLGGDPDRDVNLSTDDLKQDLSNNPKYKKALKAIRAGSANLNEARYVAKCQKKHKGTVHPEVQATVNFLKEEAQDG